MKKKIQISVVVPVYNSHEILPELVERTCEVLNHQKIEFELVLVNDGSTTVTGLNHLEGETVQLLIGDAVYPNKTVSGGQISVTIPSGAAYKTIEIGLGYSSKIKTLRVEAGSQAGTAQGRKKRYNEVMVRLHTSVGITINGDQLPFRTSATPIGHDIPEFTGDKRVMNLGWDRYGQIVIEQTQPLPMTVLGITGTLMVID